MIKKSIEILFLILGLSLFSVLYSRTPTDYFYNGATVYYGHNIPGRLCSKGNCYKTICEAQSTFPKQIIIETYPWDNQIPILTTDNILWGSTLFIFIMLLISKIFFIVYKIYYKNQEE